MASRIAPENDLERRIVSDPRWLAGAEYGKPRPGHPEGKVGIHVQEVLANLDRLDLAPEDRRRLRLVALVHDSFKHQVDRRRPRSGDNHHGWIARSFLAEYTNDVDLLDLTELHDEAYNAWQIAGRRGDPARAEARARRLIARLGARLPLYLAFYRADNATGDKQREPVEWFERLCKEGGGPGVLA